MFEEIKMIDEPVLVHVVTTKGKGYTFAEENPEKFHGLGPFDPDTGQIIETRGSAPSYSKVLDRPWLVSHRRKTTWWQLLQP